MARGYHWVFRLCHGISVKKALICAALLLQACSSHSPSPAPPKVEFVEVKYDPATMSRVRIYTGVSFLEASYSVGYSCEALSAELPVRPKNKPRPEAHLQRVQNNSKLSIGMPNSWWLTNGTAQNEKFSEMVVPAGKPFVVDIKYVGDGVCMPPARTFVPEPGVDYEAHLVWTNQAGERNSCVTVAHRLGDLPPIQLPPIRSGICVQPNKYVKSSITRWDSK